MTQNPYPSWRLRPKAAPARFRRGDPWVFADELVLDRRSKAVPAGTIVVLEDKDRQSFALAASNSSSKIAARILDFNVDATIDEAWFEARLHRALELRDHLYDAPFYRLIHAEADGLPGVVIDRFGAEVCVVQPNAAWAQMHLDALCKALKAITNAKTIYVNAQGRARQLEGLDAESHFWSGALDAPVEVAMNAALYLADITGGQKTGLFYDQRDNHAFAARLAKGGSVLDVFCHVGGFGLAALAGGATSATFVDGSQPALDLVQEAATRSGIADKCETLQGDAQDVMKTLIGQGQQFDTVVCDPPAFAPSKSALERGLRGYEKVAFAAAQLTTPGGYLVLCSCSHAADLSKFREASLRGIGKARRRAQQVHVGQAGPDHPTHARLAESAYLKALFFRLD